MRWNIDFEDTSASRNLMGPPGYESKVGYLIQRTESSPESLEIAKKAETMRARKMQEIASSPGKQLFQNALMLFLSGSGLHIVSIMMTGMALMAPLRGLMSMSTVFQPFENVNGLMRARATYLFFNCIGLAIALYRLNTMGLIPLQSSDWISLLHAQQPVELLGVSL